MVSQGSIFSSGDVIDGRFRVVRLVGTGGMGEVYEAESLETAERVAIKTVLPDLLGNRTIIARFEREAELSRRISHSCILRVFEVLKTSRPGDFGSDQVPCMVMELLTGETLADRLVDGRTVEPTAAVALACQMASGLTAAHRAGVVHRDLKPDNVFLVSPIRPPSGEHDDASIRVVLTDFGVARAVAQDDSLTASNVLPGTPDYMAPEQLELEKAMPASDIYTMGLVLFEMLTGKPPFVADTAIKMVFMRVEEEPPSPCVHIPDLDPRWEEVILRCLARQPDDRYAEAQDLILVLEGADSPWLLPTATGRFEKLSRWLAALVAAMIVAAIAAVIWL